MIYEKEVDGFKCIFDDLARAHEAYVEGSKKYHKEFSRIE